MSASKRFKRFLVRKILRKVYDPSEIFENLIPINKMNGAEIKLAMDALHTGIYEIQQDIGLITKYIAESGTQCDKCSNYDGDGSMCFKCENSGIVKNKHLCDWPW